MGAGRSVGGFLVRLTDKLCAPASFPPVALLPLRGCVRLPFKHNLLVHSPILDHLGHFLFFFSFFHYKQRLNERSYIDACALYVRVSLRFIYPEVKSLGHGIWTASVFLNTVDTLPFEVVVSIRLSTGGVSVSPTSSSTLSADRCIHFCNLLGDLLF